MFRFLLNAYYRVQTWLLELLFPARCISCRAISMLLCDRCKRTIRYHDDTRTAEDVHAAVMYHHPAAKQLIWKFKYHGDVRAGTVLAELLWESCGEMIVEHQSLATTPIILAGVPSTKKERQHRNINHTETLIQQFRSIYLDNEQLTFIPGLLVKTVHTPPQTTLSREERLHALVGTFSVPQPERVKNSIVLVFDDVTTTGATFTEARRVLLQAGAADVVCFAVAH